MARPTTKNGEQKTSNDIAFNAEQSGGVSVTEEPQAQDQQQDQQPAQDLSGIYQFTVTPYSSSDGSNTPRTNVPHIALSVIHKINNEGKLRKFNITLGSGVAVRMLRCSACGFEFESEPLLRPGGVVKDYTDEAKWLERYQDSEYCPHCRRDKPRAEWPKGFPFASGEATVMGRKIRPTYWLSHEESLRMREYLKNGRPLEQVHDVRRADGRNEKMGTGVFKTVPFTRQTKVNGMNRLVYLGNLVTFNEVPFDETFSPISGGPDASVTAATHQQTMALQRKVSVLDEQIEKALARNEKPTQLAAMFAQRKAMVEKIDILSNKIGA